MLTNPNRNFIEKFHPGHRNRALKNVDDRVNRALNGGERADGGSDGLRLKTNIFIYFLNKTIKLIWLMFLRVSKL